MSPLVLTKLSVPAARGRLISRPRLASLLTPGNGAGLILVCAPAGYGKTTLLAEWAKSLMKVGTATAWLSLDPGDDDPLPFRSYLIASFLQALGPIPELTRLAQLLRSSPEMDVQRILPVLINAVISYGRECVLILDDYHLIGSPAIHSVLVFLIEHLPKNLRIAIGSRSEPPLPLARLRARQQLFEIRVADLRFTMDETARFLNEVMRLELSEEGIASLEQRTEGWIAGLQLAALSLSGRADKEHFILSFSGSHRYLVEYLMEEVVERQPEEIQSFLLSTSILERLCAPLCDQLRGEAYPTNSQEVLESLEKSNLFLLPLDDECIWYRYHHLFRDFLRGRLGKLQPERASVLHRMACDWLAGHNLLREAAEHAFQTHDWEYAANFVEEHSFTLIIYSEISTIYEWCSVFPEEVLQSRPMLCILQGLALAYSFRKQNQSKVEARLQQAGHLIALLQDEQSAFMLNEFSAIARTFMSMAPDPAADPQELLSTARSMVDAHPQGDPGQFSGVLLTGYAYLALHDAQSAEHALKTARQIALEAHLYFGVVESTFHLARLVHSQGKLDRVMEICRQGRADITTVLTHPEQELPALGCLDIALGCVLMEQDRLDEAEQHLCNGLDLMGGGMNPYYLMTAYTALFRLCEIQRRPEEALKYLDRLEEAWPDIGFLTHVLRVAQPLRTGSQIPHDFSGLPAEVSPWSRDLPPAIIILTDLPGMGPFGAAEEYYMAFLEWSRIHIAEGELCTVQPYLDKQLDLASSNGLAQRVIELSLLSALASHAEGNMEGAVAALERALVQARPQGYLRVFDQGPVMTCLLVEAARRNICKDYIEQILAAIEKTETFSLAQKGFIPRPVVTPYGEHLSERELEVLRLMAEGASNLKIAGQLVVTVGTVKSHINHILRKLDARNRTEAVARARTLGFLKI